MIARSYPNIALIKYWGNRSEELRLPMADSLSMTLSSPSVDVTVQEAETFSVRSWNADGKEKNLKQKDVERFLKHLNLMRTYIQTLGKEDVPETLSLQIRSSIPPAIGLASSAAVFSAIAMAYAASICSTIDLNAKQISVLARLGSGSASRSLFGGYVAMLAGKGMDIDAAYAEQIADEQHWNLHDVIVVPSHTEKKVGSTEGHALASTSPLFTTRIRELPQRQVECRDAIRKKDFEKLQMTAETDALDMHRVVETSDPPINYLNDVTHRILGDISVLRMQKHLPVLFTMDAGPTVHLLCEEEALNNVREFAHAQEDCTVYESAVGSGTTLLS